VICYWCHSSDEFSWNAEESLLEVPVRITVPDQPLPVFTTIRARLTDATLSFDPPSIDFGSVPLTEVASLSVKITNHACLPQKYETCN